MSIQGGNYDPTRNRPSNPSVRRYTNGTTHLRKGSTAALKNRPGPRRLSSRITTKRKDVGRKVRALLPPARAATWRALRRTIRRSLFPPVSEQFTAAVYGEVGHQKKGISDLRHQLEFVPSGHNFHGKPIDQFGYVFQRDEASTIPPTCGLACDGHWSPPEDYDSRPRKAGARR